MEVLEAPKEAVLLKIHPELAEKLRVHKARTRLTYAEIIEPLLREFFEKNQAATA